MDQTTKDFMFMEHFNPKRDTSLTPKKPCPFCHSVIYSVVDGKRTCYRCGRTYEDKENE